MIKTQSDNPEGALFDGHRHGPWDLEPQLNDAMKEGVLKHGTQIRVINVEDLEGPGVPENVEGSYVRHDKRGVLVAEEAPDGSTIEHPLPARLVDQVRLVHHAVDGSVDKTRSRGVRSRVRSWFGLN